MNIVEFMVLIFFPLTMVGFGYFGVKKLINSKNNPYNFWTFLFFLSIFIGMLINVLYILFSAMIVDSVYMFLSRVAAMFLSLSLAFPPYFLLGVKKGFKTISQTFTFFYFTCTALFHAGILILGRTNLSAERNNIYNPLLGYYILFLDTFYLGLFLYFSISILQHFDDVDLSKRFISYIFGYGICAILIFLAVLGNMQVISREIIAFLYGLGILPGGFLIYNGIERKMK